MEVVKVKQPIEKIDVWFGKKHVSFVDQDIYKTIKKLLSVKYNGLIEAPVKKDQVVGKLRFVDDEEILVNIGFASASTNVEKLTFLQD